MSTEKKDALLCFLAEKITLAEKIVKAREQSAVEWRSGTKAEWDAAGAMHPATAGLKYSKRERLAIAETEDRIVIKLRRELEMFKACASALTL